MQGCARFIHQNWQSPHRLISIEASVLLPLRCRWTMFCRADSRSSSLVGPYDVISRSWRRPTSGRGMSCWISPTDRPGSDRTWSHPLCIAAEPGSRSTVPHRAPRPRLGVEASGAARGHRFWPSPSSFRRFLLRAAHAPITCKRRRPHASTRLAGCRAPPQGLPAANSIRQLACLRGDSPSPGILLKWRHSHARLVVAVWGRSPSSSSLILILTQGTEALQLAAGCLDHPSSLLSHVAARRAALIASGLYARLNLLERLLRLEGYETQISRPPLVLAVNRASRLLDGPQDAAKGGSYAGAKIWNMVSWALSLVPEAFER